MQWLIDIILETFKGMILMWSGSIATIPDGWALCDGNNGTPDLRARFIRGATHEAPPGGTGGSPTHDHDFTGDGHFHEAKDPIDGAFLGGAVFAKQVTTEVVTGTTDATLQYPPYYHLAYIMKL